MSKASRGKPLKGDNLISQRGGIFELDSIVSNSLIIGDIEMNDIISGDFVFDPIDINSGTIDGIVIGGDNPGPGFFTILQTGNSDGTGFNTVFYGTTTGDSFSWNANSSTVNINGALNVRDTVNLGNLRVDANTISSIGINNDIILDPNGTGCVVINSCIEQNSSSGNVSFNIENGNFEAISGDTMILQSINDGIYIESHANTDITTHNGSIELATEIGTVLCISNITQTSAGVITLTTETEHNMSSGFLITIKNSDTIPNLDGQKTVLAAPSNKTFTINGSLTSSGSNSALLIKNIRISNIPLASSGTLVITTLFDHNFNPGDEVVIAGVVSLNGAYVVQAIPTSKQFSILATNIGGVINNTGTVTKTLNNTIKLHSNQIKLTGNIEINKDSCAFDDTRSLDIYNTNVKFDDNLLTIGGVLDTDISNKDKGFLFNWYDTTSKQGFVGFDASENSLTFIPDSTVVDDVVSGIKGNFLIGDISTTGVNVNNGDIINVDTIFANNLEGSPDLHLIASGDIYLDTSSVIVPESVPILLGASIINTASNNLTVSTTTLNLSASSDIVIPSSIPIKLGSSTEFISGNSGNVNIDSGSVLNINTPLTIVSGDLRVNGTTTTVNSTIVEIKDPVITLGSGSVLDDNKDRGIQFNWVDGATSKIGFFGFDDSTGCFTIIPDAINNNEVFSGAPGCISVGEINLNNGNIINGGIIDTIELHGEPNLTLSATQDINLNAVSDVNIPGNVGLTFGDDSNKIEYNTAFDSFVFSTDSLLNLVSNQTIIGSSTDIQLNAAASVDIPVDVPLQFAGTDNFIYSDGVDLIISSVNNTVINSTDVNLNASSSVNIPTNIPLNLSDSGSVFISGSLTDLQITGDDILLNASSAVIIPADIGLIFGDPVNKIEYVSGSDLIITSLQDIQLNPAGTDVIINGNLFVTGTTNIGVSGGGTGSGTVDDYIVCLGKGQDLAIVGISNSGSTVTITTALHSLVIGDIVTISGTSTTESLDGVYTITTVPSTTTFTIEFTGSLTVLTPVEGNVRTKHVDESGKDVGVCIDWHDGVIPGTDGAKKGFFGFDIESLRFKYIPDGDISAAYSVSGDVGDVEFAHAYLTNTSVSSLTSSRIVFAGINGLLTDNLSFTYDSLLSTLSVPTISATNITADSVIADNLVTKQDFNANSILKADTDNIPITLDVPENTILGRKAGGVISALTVSEVNSIIGLSNTFERISPLVESFISGISSGSTTPTITTPADHGLITGDSVNIYGSNSVPVIDGNYIVTVMNTTQFNITVPVPISSPGSNGFVQPFGMSVVNPATTNLISFVSVRGQTGIASGTLSPGTDGSFKHIIMSSIPNGSKYELTLQLLDPGTSEIGLKKLTFTCAGQSSHLIYDATLAVWIIVNSGAFIY